MASVTESPDPQSCLSTPSQRHLDMGRSPAVVQRRTGPSTGGHGRAWSEEEENYLIETRQHKMPYKHIAAHLQKTELACRLHYHQLSGPKSRRRRASSSSSNRSGNSGGGQAGSGSTGSGREPSSQHSTPPTRSYAATLSPPESPETGGRARAGSSPPQPVPILPRPRNAVLDRARCLPPPSANALGLITGSEERADERAAARGGVDGARLARVYDAHRAPFWTAVARDYGGGASPALLEDAWRQQQLQHQPLCGPALPPPNRFVGGQLPPTPPNGSPSAEQAQLAAPAGPAAAGGGPAPLEPALADRPPPNTFSPINGPARTPQSTPCLAQSRGSFAIASLLTEERSPRP